ncbi:Low molecular weight phosphotyrosine protein phosphatase protein [Pseudomonas syringae pv. maculicola]|uniref:protein-tyrosine-phosphatase n=1 Tax=Pseudomonas syringae pv. maculicola TaxID=59511 RepID=A0A0N0G134_PSEYM|nr:MULTISPECIES: low molecular weight protein-tyrosine-phosphatase [Pseudomonas syringae group]MBF9243464.1 low molecular weight phosphotyrosine protein phosphatase [Pseudomonas syringae pv. tomato]KKI25864.1 phosphotyrosine protein phosphatase [Pseudomonas syringae pv. persicae]KPB94902.1 Low molecular weight phosphotyrosine protein phosphatase family protein [Pseudomonas syringae pv. maculicola]KPC02793.1 Low molecular weight phosphotyrosine protein phosphatase family protein [Pseudomonas syr
MFSNVLVLCVGNICRSPMAVAMICQRLAATNLGATQMHIQSAGIAALSGSPIDPTAQAVLQSHQVHPQDHTAQQMTRELLHQADLILLMEQAHVHDVLKRAPEVRGRTFLMGKWQHRLDIADPYRLPTSAFEQTYAQLSRCIDDWLPHFQAGATR